MRNARESELRAVTVSSHGSHYEQLEIITLELFHLLKHEIVILKQEMSALHFAIALLMSFQDGAVCLSGPVQDEI